MDIIKEIANYNQVVIATHKNADPDALASVLITCYIIKRLGSNCCSYFPEDLNKVSKRLVSELNIDIFRCKNIDDANALLIVDASNRVQLGDLSEKVDNLKALYLIDHHEPGDLIKISKRFYVNKDSTSNTQILVLATEKLNLKLDAKLATLALAGIIYDSRRFQFIDLGMLDAVKRLILWRGSYEKALELLKVPTEEFSLRYAKLKSLQRLKLGRACKELLVAVTRIGSYESKVARTLIDLGADVAVVIGYHDREIRVSMRISEVAFKRCISAVALAKFIADRLGGQGGGHARAAMVHIRTEELSDESIDNIVDEIAKSLPGKVARLCTSCR